MLSGDGDFETPNQPGLASIRAVATQIMTAARRIDRISMTVMITLDHGASCRN